MHGKLSGCWNTWREVAMEGARNAMLVRRGLKRLMNAKLSGAFGGWREATAAMQEDSRPAIDTFACKLGHERFPKRAEVQLTGFGDGARC